MDFLYLLTGFFLGIIVGGAFMKKESYQNLLEDFKWDLKEQVQGLGQDESVHFILSIEKESHNPTNCPYENQEEDEWKFERN